MTSPLRETMARIVCRVALAIFVPAYLYTNIRLLPISGGITTCLAFTFALVLASTATSRHWFARALSNRWMVLGGEASYSLYLLQYWVMHQLGHQLADGWPAFVRFLIFLALLPVAAVVSRVSYRFFEKPATRLVRKLLSGARKGSQLEGSSSEFSFALLKEDQLVPHVAGVEAMSTALPRGAADGT
jgi:peptidoglycan/LPS O-acetylase OafA/YrhL